MDRILIFLYASTLTQNNYALRVGNQPNEYFFKAVANKIPVPYFLTSTVSICADSLTALG